MIELQLDDGHSYHVVVVGLDAQRVTLDLASRRLNVSRQEIEPVDIRGPALVPSRPKRRVRVGFDCPKSSQTERTTYWIE